MPETTGVAVITGTEVEVGPGVEVGRTGVPVGCGAEVGKLLSTVGVDATTGVEVKSALAVALVPAVGLLLTVIETGESWTEAVMLGSGVTRVAFGWGVPPQALNRTEKASSKTGIKPSLLAVEYVFNWPVFFFKTTYFLSRGTLFIISSITLSDWIPSASPSKLRISRWRSAGSATALTSSKATL